MQFFMLPILLFALLTASWPLHERADDGKWLVKSFSSSVAPHSISQITAFSLARPAINETISCSNVTGAAISANPYLVPVQDGKCAPQSSFSFSFRQLNDYVIELSVKNNESDRVGTYTSGPDSVTTVTTGPNPFDTVTSYVGPRDFELTFGY